ncbi:MAG: glycosyltransferase family 4 protein [Anaerolineae bacterium]|nr:glycosyltransferase family 4 protein [Anaerolineae bacterium]
MNTKPRLAVLSGVLPFPGRSGQQQRVANKLRAFREQFHVTFITIAASDQVEQVRAQLTGCVDDVILLQWPALDKWQVRWRYVLPELTYVARTGAKRSNYWLSQIAFTPENLQTAVAGHEPFDVVVFEYWHAHQAAPFWQATGARCILDMHDILWQSYDRQLQARPLPAFLRQRMVARYRWQEERAWTYFDGLITINSAEHDYVAQRLPRTPLYYAPMGVDLTLWPYSWQPADPPRIGYYGGLGSSHNQRDALLVYAQIMPHVWAQFPDAELWLVGSNPPEHMLELGRQDPRVQVTGFVEDVAAVLRTLALVICPWQGRYGFRSRLIEVMATGVPIVASADAAYGMDFVHGKGIFFADDDTTMAKYALRLLDDKPFCHSQSQVARRQVEQRYSFEDTYVRLATQLHDWLPQSEKPVSEARCTLT